MNVPMTSEHRRLEQAIDAAGREAVFAEARAHGWLAGIAPPLWVWWQIVHHVRTRRQEADQR